MENAIKGFFLNRVLPSGVYNAHRAPWRSIIIQFVFVSLLLAYPLAQAVYRLDGAAVIRGLFPAAFGTSTADDYSEAVFYTPDDAETDAYTRFDRVLEIHDDYAVLHVFGLRFAGDRTDDLNGDVSSLNDAAEMASGALLTLYAVLSLVMYPVTFLLNAVFLPIMAGLLMLFNIGSSARFSFKESLAFTCFAATIPAVAALISGWFFGAAFVYLVYNFGLAGWAILCRKRGEAAEQVNFEKKRYKIWYDEENVNETPDDGSKTTNINQKRER